MAGETSQEYSVTIHNSINDIAASQWNACTEGNPFISHEFLAALENSDCVSAEQGWQPYHLQLKKAGDQTAGFMPLYVKSHSYGEYVFDHGWADAYERAGGRYYPKLQGSVPFTPVNCPKLLIAPEEEKDQAMPALLQALITCTDRLSLSSAHMTFLTEPEQKAAQKSGFLLRMDQQFHWKNNAYKTFEDFLASLTSRKRKQIRKERRTATENGIVIERLHGTNITEEAWDAFYTFYLDTSSRKWGTPYLNRAFFREIAATMPEKTLLIMCKRNGRYIAGAINFLGPKTLYGRYWGCNEDHPCLHFETCYYQAIEYAIDHGIELVEAGAQGQHKLARGYEPTPTCSAHFIRNASFREAIAQFLITEKEHVGEEIRYLSEHTPFKKGDNSTVDQ